MRSPDLRDDYGAGDSRVSECLDRVWNIGRFAVPLGAIAWLLASGSGADETMPHVNDTFPERGVLATPVIGTPVAENSPSVQETIDGVSFIIFEE